MSEENGSWTRVGQPRLVAGSDIADHYGVTNSAVTNWRADHLDFPEPYARVGRGHTPVWLMSEIQEWRAAVEAKKSKRKSETNRWKRS